MANNLVSNILLAVMFLSIIGIGIYLFTQKDQVVAGPPGPPGPAGSMGTPGVTIPAPSGSDTVILPPEEGPPNHGTVELDEANYGPVLATQPFPLGFVPGPTASPCIVSRYLLDLPGMPSYLAQERLPWTYEERLVLQTIQNLCADGNRVRIIQQSQGFGFLAYIIYSDDVPYDYDYALIYQPKLGWQLIKCLGYGGAFIL